MSAFLKTVALGDSKPSFESLYEQYQQLVRNVLFRMVGASELDDLVQESFVKIWKGLPNFAGRSSYKTWIYRITLRTAIDFLRKRKPGSLEFEPSDTSLVERQDAQRTVLNGLAQLSVDHRAVVVLCHLEGFTIEQASEILGVEQGTIKSRLHHARKNMLDFFRSEGIEL